MNILTFSANIMVALLVSTAVFAEHHIDDLMSEGVDYDSETVETVTTQTINMPLANKPSSNIKRPSRTQSKNTVVNEFGNPLKQHKPKGKPPIERWDYPDFSVYFESNYVIHSVVRSNNP